MNNSHKESLYIEFKSSMFKWIIKCSRDYECENLNFFTKHNLL